MPPLARPYQTFTNQTNVKRETCEIHAIPSARGDVRRQMTSRAWQRFRAQSFALDRVIQVF